jgi:hypothetical protein
VQFYERLCSRLDVLPGVEAAGGTSFLPLTGPGAATSYFVVGQPDPPAGQEHVADVYWPHARFPCNGMTVTLRVTGAVDGNPQISSRGGA